ncbi:MAG: hypothetical protein ACRENY_01515 [Candidatus Dormibacteria bacterium]
MYMTHAQPTGGRLVYYLPGAPKVDGVGYAMKTTWAIVPNYFQTVYLTGQGLSGEGALHFQFVGPQQVAARLGLKAGTSSKGYFRATGLVLVPASGCYKLTASWSSGSWSIVFAAGK